MVQQLRNGLLAVALVSIPIPAVSQAEDAAESAFMDVKMKMRESMPVDYSGDADVEFMRSMIHQHEGAIGLAEVELKYGKDPQARAFAEEILETQKVDIDRLKEWLAQH
jgi:uncharacterized protein (DUF305 family)